MPAGPAADARKLGRRGPSDVADAGARCVRVGCAFCVHGQRSSARRRPLAFRRSLCPATLTSPLPPTRLRPIPPTTQPRSAPRRWSTPRPPSRAPCARLGKQAPAATVPPQRTTSGARARRCAARSPGSRPRCATRTRCWSARARAWRGGGTGRRPRRTPSTRAWRCRRTTTRTAAAQQERQRQQQQQRQQQRGVSGADQGTHRV